MKKLIAVVIVAVFLASLMPMTPVAAVSSQSLARPTSALDNLEGISGTSRLETIVVEGAQPDSGNPWEVIVLDFLDDTFYTQTFECVAQGVYGNIWIGLNDTDWSGYTDYYDDKGTPELHDDEWHFMYPWTHTGIPEFGIPVGYHDVIYGKNITYVLNEFDNNIHDKVTSVFGMYADRPGPFDPPDYKIQILIFNFRDWLFWTPVEAPYFVEGYFWSYASWINNANIMHIDTWQWDIRLGPQPLHPTHAYEYEGTFAHEFQHLVHRDVDFDELSWVNEGCSTLAEYICGYGFSPGHISQYLMWYWDTSLTIWEEYLSNYGVVFLWTFYVYEHYGGEPLIWDIVHEQANGIEGYNKVFKRHHVKKTFDEVFQDWTIANYLDDTSLANGIYGYYDLDIPSQNTVGQLAPGWPYWEWSIPLSVWVWEALGWFDFQIDSYPTANAMLMRLPYIAHYFELYDYDPALELHFDGDDYAGVFPNSGMYEWYSDGTGDSWFRLYRTFDLTGVTEATLKFWSNYDIEENYDFGYVEVHDLYTNEWYTLEGIETVSTVNVDGYNNPNCPDIFEPTTYLAAGRWYGFTGSSGGWYQEEMDLSMFAGHTIDLYFTYWTDPYTLGLGWYIDDVEIPEIGFFDDVESGQGDWEVNDGWYITTGIVSNDFEVNFVRMLEFEGGMVTSYDIVNMELDDETEDGWQILREIDNKIIQTVDPTVMVIANQPGFEHTFQTFYWFYVDIKPHPGSHPW